MWIRDVLGVGLGGYGMGWELMKWFQEVRGPCGNVGTDSTNMKNSVSHTSKRGIFGGQLMTMMRRVRVFIWSCGLSPEP